MSNAFSHDGMDYVSFFSCLDNQLRPDSYFEIGTNTGGSLRAFSCDAVVVDPVIQIEGFPSHDVIGARKRLFLFQMTSDEFFRHQKLRYFLPDGPDIAFLDGLHLFEFLLRDFINTERACHDRSTIFLHDCLPLNTRMAERAPRVDDHEIPETRGAWTGDVWRLLPILKRYRPEMRVVALNCAPTGLVACSRLDPTSTILRDNYHAIVEEYRHLDLASFGLPRLWSEVQMIDTRSLSKPPYDFTAIFNVA